MTGKWFYAEYSAFSLDSETNQYAINVSGYVGNAGDSLANISLSKNYIHNGRKFTTKDRDNDEKLTGNCEAAYRAGWWYSNCMYSCLTCEFASLDFTWNSLITVCNEPNALLMAARMMIRSN